MGVVVRVQAQKFRATFLPLFPFLFLSPTVRIPFPAPESQAQGGGARVQTTLAVSHPQRFDCPEESTERMSLPPHAECGPTSLVCVIGLLLRMNRNQPSERATRRWSGMERRSESGTLSCSSQALERRPHLMWPRSLPSGRTRNQVPLV